MHGSWLQTCSFSAWVMPYKLMLSPRRAILGSRCQSLFSKKEQKEQIICQEISSGHVKLNSGYNRPSSVPHFIIIIYPSSVIMPLGVQRYLENNRTTSLRLAHTRNPDAECSLHKRAGWHTYLIHETSWSISSQEAWRTRTRNPVSVMEEGADWQHRGDGCSVSCVMDTDV